MIVLHYTGGQALPDVPARDLTADDLSDVAAHGYDEAALIASGHYEAPAPPPVATPTPPQEA